MKATEVARTTRRRMRELSQPPPSRACGVTAIGAAKDYFLQLLAHHSGGVLESLLGANLIQQLLYGLVRAALLEPPALEPFLRRATCNLIRLYVVQRSEAPPLLVDSSWYSSCQSAGALRLVALRWRTFVSIRKRKDRDGYLIDFTYEYPDGRKLRVREMSQHANLRAAKDEEAALRQAVKDGTYKIRAGEDTLAGFSEEFFAKALVKKKASTKAGYKTVYDQHLKKRTTSTSWAAT
jgi:hypothetical protein